MNPLLDELAARQRHEDLQRAARQRHALRAALEERAAQAAGDATPPPPPLTRLRLWLAALGAPHAPRRP